MQQSGVLAGNIHHSHRSRTGATAGYRQPRTLNEKGPVMEHSISSYYHIRKRKLQGHQTLSQLKQPLKLTQKRKKYYERRVINLHYITLNNTAQLAKLCMSIDTKCGFAYEGYNLTNFNRLPLKQSMTKMLDLSKIFRCQRDRHVDCA